MAEEEIDRLKKEIQEYKPKHIIIMLFVPISWLPIQMMKRQTRQHLRQEQINKKQRKESISDSEKFIKAIKLEINKYSTFDKQKVDNDLDRLSKEIDLINEDFKRVAELKNNVDVALRPIMEQITKDESSISVAKGIINKAQSLEEELKDADNSYERAMIHEECENAFGEGSPKKIIGQQERTIRKLERDLEKADKRATLIAEKASRDIRKIIIDGNNMCYESNKFVGLKPLIQTTIELQKQYKLIVVFDSAIRSQVNAGDNTVRTKFNSNIEVHIVATKQLADETILDIASNDDLCYVISNDRFGEYKEKEVVKNNRLIRHEVVSGKVIIHDLNINLKYA